MFSPQRESPVDRCVEDEPRPVLEIAAEVDVLDHHSLWAGFHDFDLDGRLAIPLEMPSFGEVAQSQAVEALLGVFAVGRPARRSDSRRPSPG